MSLRDYEIIAITLVQLSLLRTQSKAFYMNCMRDLATNFIFLR